MLLKLVTLDPVSVDKGLLEALLHGKNNHYASKDMDLDQGLETKSKNF